MVFDFSKSIVEPIEFRGRRIWLKRDDLITPIGGNKARKCYGLFSGSDSVDSIDFINSVDWDKVERIVSWGGAQSNAMLALAEVAQLMEKEFVYYCQRVPGWLLSDPIGNFLQALSYGMDLRREEFVEVDSMRDGSSLVIPQGMAMPEAEAGIRLLADSLIEFSLREFGNKKWVIFLPSGTGTTAFYLHKHLKKCANAEVWTVPCIGDADVLSRFFQKLNQTSKLEIARLPEIVEGSEKEVFGGLSERYWLIYQELLNETGLEFDLLYDAKAWCVLVDRWGDRSGEIDANTEIIYLHQGGVTGNESMISRYKRYFLKNDKIGQI